MRLILPIAFAFSLSAASDWEKSPANNDFVSVGIELNHGEPRPGGAAEVLLTFKPKKGIHITVDPRFEVRLDTLKRYFSLGIAEFAKDREGYVDHLKPARQHILVAKDTPPGSYSVKTTLTYYYCSDAEGWCARSKQPIALSLRVRR